MDRYRPPACLKETNRNRSEAATCRLRCDQTGDELRSETPSCDGFCTENHMQPVCDVTLNFLLQSERRGVHVLLPSTSVCTTNMKNGSGVSVFNTAAGGGGAYLPGSASRGSSVRESALKSKGSASCSSSMQSLSARPPAREYFASVQHTTTLMNQQSSVFPPHTCRFQRRRRHRGDGV